ncbi:MAG TPA: glycoside hydrolase family 10 protein, partial [Rhodothermales bacterium]|nr:glycoside hydrolase family 10 protein [Rhodothermales bacterium]
MKSRLLFLLSLWLVPLANAQNAKHEFRGAWVASVANLDWPSCNGCSSSVQQTQLVQIMDGLKEAGVNAVVFQVRTESDALYDSPYEPWSYWLTGEQGTAPDPFFDPLELAVELAHERGMELHAWINPYRADRGSSYPKADNHVTNTHPEWILSYPSGIKILDPGIPDVRDHVTGVIGDILRRYDVDGIHYDDYFYPYEGTSDEDDATFATYNRGFTNRGDWRRDNINLL